MAGVNKVILIGNLGGDPEVRYTPGGQAVANFRIACSESWTDKQGEKQERTEWVRIVAWGKLGELCGEYLQKGRPVYVEGKLQTREWTDKEDRKQWSTEVVASNVVFLGSKGEGGGSRDDDSFGEPPRNDAPRRSGGASADAVFPPYGKAKGKPVRGASREDLEYYANGCRKSLNDVSKAKYHAAERALLAAIEAELSMGGGSGGYDGTPRGGPSDDDIPF